jgi:hypothetical protein
MALHNVSFTRALTWSIRSMCSSNRNSLFQRFHFWNQKVSVARAWQATHRPIIFTIRSTSTAFRRHVCRTLRTWRCCASLTTWSCRAMHHARARHVSAAAAAAAPTTRATCHSCTRTLHLAKARCATTWRRFFEAATTTATVFRKASSRWFRRRTVASRHSCFHWVKARCMLRHFHRAKTRPALLDS